MKLEGGTPEIPYFNSWTTLPDNNRKMTYFYSQQSLNVTGLNLTQTSETLPPEFNRKYFNTSKCINSIVGNFEV